jgi:excisionase family DNA binding protein
MPQRHDHSGPTGYLRSDQIRLNIGSNSRMPIIASRWEWAGEAQLKTETDSLLSIDELAKRLNCHPSTVRRLTKLGRLPAVRIGWLYRYDLEAVLKALKNQARQDSPVR